MGLEWEVELDTFDNVDIRPDSSLHSLVSHLDLSGGEWSSSCMLVTSVPCMPVMAKLMGGVDEVTLRLQPNVPCARMIALDVL